jgi:hypothetical protein
VTNSIRYAAERKLEAAKESEASGKPCQHGDLNFANSAMKGTGLVNAENGLLSFSHLAKERTSAGDDALKYFTELTRSLSERGFAFLTWTSRALNLRLLTPGHFDCFGPD